MLEINRTDYEREKEARERRLKAYADEIQNQVRDKSREIVKELVEERHKHTSGYGRIDWNDGI